jgi:hypothetical protein
MPAGYRRSLVGFAFEGAGLDTSKAGGLCVSWGRHAPHPSSSFEWVEALVSLPQGVSTEVNPFTGEWSTSAFTVEIEASDRLAQLFLSDQRRTSIALATALNDTNTSVSLVNETLAGQLVWIDDECILLGIHAGLGIYGGCTRAYWGTRAVAHKQGSLAFTRVPYWETRQVRLIEQDVDSGAETIRWRGLVRAIAQDRGAIIIQCEEYLAALARAEVNRAPRDLAQGLGLSWQVFSVSTTLRGGPIAGYTSAVVTDAGSPVFLEADGYIAQTTTPILAGAASPQLTTWLYGRRPEASDGDAYEGGLWEVLVVPEQLAGVEDYPPAHPLTAALALLTSTGTGRNGPFDILGASWGLGIDVVDLPSWEEEMLRSPHLSVDHLVLGAGGASVNVLSVVQDTLLRPFGYFLAITTTGLLSLARLRLPTVADATAAAAGVVNAYPDGPLVLDRGLGQQAQEIVATVGGTPGTGDGRELTLKQADTLTRRQQLGDIRRHRYDLQILSPRRISNSRRSTGAVVSALASLLSLGLDTSPRLKVRIADHNITGALPPDMGAWLSLASLGPLQDAWLVNAQGERVSDVTGPEWIGMVIGRAWDLERHTYELTLLLLAYRTGAYTRERAPSAVVSSWDLGTLTLTVEPNTFGGDPSDPETFTVGDQVRISGRDGTPIDPGEVRTVVAVTGTTIQVNAAWTTAPTAGRVIGIAASPDYKNATRYPITIRPYVFMGSADEGGFEDGDGNQVALDVYGTSVFGGV